MKKNESKRAYMFYVSDYHFEMIGLLNINKELNQNKKVIILTQNDLEETVGTVLSKINIKDEEKQKIKNINWKHDDNSKYKEIKLALAEDQEISVYIKGDEKYIQLQNKKIDEILNVKNNISITDCYNFYEIAEKSGEIIRKYDQALVTDKKIKVEDNF